METQEDMDIWVDGQDGYDGKGHDGSQSKPYATVTRALEDVPHQINHSVHIRVAAGIYNSFPEEVVRRFGDGDAQLSIEGTGNADVVDGPFTVGTITTDSRYIYTKIQVPSAGWTADEFYGKHVEVTAGTGTGWRVPIFKNTSDTIYTLGYLDFEVGTMTEFKVVDPSVHIKVDHQVRFDCESMQPLGAPSSDTLLAGTNFLSRVALGGILLETTQTDASYGFVFSNGAYALPFSTLKVLDSNDRGSFQIRVALLQNAKVNAADIADPDGFDNSKLSEWAQMSTQAVTGDSPPTGGYKTSFSFNGNCKLWTIVTRMYIEVAEASSSVEIGFCHLCGVNVANGAFNSSTYCYMDNAGLTGSEALKTHWESKLSAYKCHIEDVDKQDAVDCDGGASIWLESNTCVPANVSRYGARVKEMGKLIRNTSDGISGNTNDCYFVNNDTAQSWPASNTMISDNSSARIYTQ